MFFCVMFLPLFVLCIFPLYSRLVYLYISYRMQGMWHSLNTLAAMVHGLTTPHREGSPIVQLWDALSISVCLAIETFTSAQHFIRAWSKNKFQWITFYFKFIHGCWTAHLKHLEIHWFCIKVYSICHLSSRDFLPLQLTYDKFNLFNLTHD